jgi:signal transduction histidine kinase
MRSLQEIAWQAKEKAAADAQAARADERTAIARELHDLVAHHVASMVLRIGVARHVLSPDPKVAQILDDVHASGSSAMADLRTLVSVLRDPDGGHAAVTDLQSALRAAVDRIEAAGPEVRAEIDPAVGDLDAVLTLAVLRVVQEGLTNVLKHAGPQAKVMLTVARDGTGVEVSLQDDGPGAPAAPGHGLIGMRERVELAGGRLSTGPTGSGWRVHAKLPA